MLRFAVVTFSFLALYSAYHPVFADESAGSKQRLVYDVYAGGIHAVQAELIVDMHDDDRYYMNLSAQTRGFLGKLAPWHGTFETEGWRTSPAKPEIHRSTTTWRDEPAVKEFSYGKDGTFKGLTITEDGEDRTPQSIEDALTQGTTDALTATLHVMNDASDGKACDSSAEVFDGKRRYALHYTQEEIESLVRSRYNVYEGPSQRCVVEAVPISGAWHKKPRGWMSIQEQGRIKGSLPTIWLAQMDKNGPAVPVKIRVKTDYGTLFMHLVNYDNGKQSLTLK